MLQDKPLSTLFTLCWEGFLLPANKVAARPCFQSCLSVALTASVYTGGTGPVQGPSPGLLPIQGHGSPLPHPDIFIIVHHEVQTIGKWNVDIPLKRLLLSGNFYLGKTTSEFTLILCGTSIEIGGLFKSVGISNYYLGFF